MIHRMEEPAPHMIHRMEEQVPHMIHRMEKPAPYMIHRMEEPAPNRAKNYLFNVVSLTNHSMNPSLAENHVRCREFHEATILILSGKF